MKKEKIIIYCDGACSGNQFNSNKGGWGAVLKYKDHTKEICGGEKNTTNQKMELTAAIKALEEIKIKNVPIEIYSDSAYLVNCMKQKWYFKWQQNGWINSKKEPVANKELWTRLLELIKIYKVDFHKVVGHSGDELNEMADQLANKGIEEAAKK
jgi:ribonuclease HI